MEQHDRQRYEDYKSFMRRHQKAVWRICYHFAHGDIPLCEDMVQEVWARLWLKFDTMTSRSERKQRIWVYKVTRSVLVDLQRREARKANPLVRLEDLSDDLVDEEVRASGDLAERIDDLLSVLTPDEQRLMRMRLDGYSADEIASEFKIETNAVYQRVNRIKKKLKQYKGGHETLFRSTLLAVAVALCVGAAAWLMPERTDTYVSGNLQCCIDDACSRINIMISSL